MMGRSACDFEGRVITSTHNDGYIIESEHP